MLLPLRTRVRIVAPKSADYGDREGTIVAIANGQYGVNFTNNETEQLETTTADAWFLENEVIKVATNP